MRSILRRHITIAHIAAPRIPHALVALLSLLLGACATQPASPPPPARVDGDTAALISQLRDWRDYVMERNDLVGLGVAVVVDGQVLWLEAKGWADRESRLPLRDDTLLRAGSITKVFNALLVGRAVAEGRLTLDEDIRRWLPALDLRDADGNTQTLSLRQLLSHQSGLPSDWIHGMWTNTPEGFHSALGYLSATPLLHAPGEIQLYSNLSHDVIAAVLGVALGRDYQQQMAEALRQLGMIQATLSADPGAPASAQGYAEGRVAPELGLRDVPAAGLSTGLRDLASGLQAMLAMARGESDFLPADQFAQLWADANSGHPLNLGRPIGLGFMHYRDVFRRGVPVVGHSGAAVSHRALIKLAPEHGLAVALLSNSRESGGALHRLANEALRLAYEYKFRKRAPRAIAAWPRPRAEHDTRLESLQGFFATPAGLARIDGNNVRIGGRKLALYQRSDGGFWYGRYRLWGLLPINLGALGNLGIAVQQIDGRDYLVALNTWGEAQLLGPRVKPTPIPQAWRQRLGRYRILTPLEVIGLHRGGLRERDGFLLAYAHSSRGERMEVVLRPLDEQRALVEGIGRGLGESVYVDFDGSFSRLRYSGLIFERLPRAGVGPQRR